LLKKYINTLISLSPILEEEWGSRRRRGSGEP